MWKIDNVVNYDDETQQCRLLFVTRFTGQKNASTRNSKDQRQRTLNRLMRIHGLIKQINK